MEMLFKELSNDIKHILLRWEFTDRELLSQISCKPFIFSTCFLEIQIGGSLSQNVEIVFIDNRKPIFFIHIQNSRVGWWKPTQMTDKINKKSYFPLSFVLPSSYTHVCLFNPAFIFNLLFLNILRVGLWSSDVTVFLFWNIIQKHIYSWYIIQDISHVIIHA